MEGTPADRLQVDSRIQVVVGDQIGVEQDETWMPQEGLRSLS